jgi:hypothetical protein
MTRGMAIAVAESDRPAAGDRSRLVSRAALNG